MGAICALRTMERFLYYRCYQSIESVYTGGRNGQSVGTLPICWIYCTGDVVDTIRWKHANLDINAISTKLGLPLAESRKICSAMGIYSNNPTFTQQGKKPMTKLHHHGRSLSKRQTYTADQFKTIPDWWPPGSFNVWQLSHSKVVRMSTFSPKNEDGLRARRQAAWSALTDMISC